MKKSIFIGGKIRELDFAQPFVFEREMRKDLTSFLKQEVPFMVTADSKSKAVAFLWPIHLKPDLSMSGIKIQTKFVRSLFT